MTTDHNIGDFSAGTAELDIQVISRFVNTLKNLDVKDLVKKGILPKENTEAHLFDLLSESSLNSLFRKTKDASEILTDLWVSKVFQKARNLFLKNTDVAFSPDEFDHQYLIKIAQLSINENSINQVQKILLKKGIVFIIEPYIAGSKVDGVSLKLPNGIPVIGLSIRYPRMDNFWFTLLHELAHILLHYDQLDKPIIDDLDNHTESKIEKQANITAKHSIISKQILRTIDLQEIKNKSYLIKIAQQAHVHPALIAGLYRFELKDYTIHSDIVHQVNIKKIIDGTL